MNGQWIGPFTGTNAGLLTINIDDIGSEFSGVATAINHDPSLPATFGEFIAPKGQSKFDLRIPVKAVVRQTAAEISAEDMQKAFSGIVVPAWVDSAWQVEQSSIRIEWVTQIGTHGEAVIEKSKGGDSSTLAPLPSVTTWAEFKDYATRLEPYHHLFRGQENNSWKLRTAFFRSGRANLTKFMREDVNTLHRHLSGLTTHQFNLGDPLDYAAFLSLVQHHGYPTPLLDWTQSPFIAAYFAFRNLDLRNAKEGACVRIHVLRGRDWNSMERAVVMSPAFLHMTVLEPLAINNPRVVPQQAVSLVTNVDDLEWYINEKERGGTKFLTAIDLPVSERPMIMRELALMGINAGSLFPGLDGACNQLRERYFDF